MVTRIAQERKKSNNTNKKNPQKYIEFNCCVNQQLNEHKKKKYFASSVTNLLLFVQPSRGWKKKIAMELNIYYRGQRRFHNTNFDITTFLFFSFFFLIRFHRLFSIVSQPRMICNKVVIDQNNR